MKIWQYTIVTAETPEALTTLVQALIHLGGWQPYGPVAVLPQTGALCQPMVMYEAAVTPTHNIPLETSVICANSGNLAQ